MCSGFTDRARDCSMKSMESLHDFNMGSITSPTFQPFQTRVAEQLNCVKSAAGMWGASGVAFEQRRQLNWQTSLRWIGQCLKRIFVTGFTHRFMQPCFASTAKHVSFQLESSPAQVLPRLRRPDGEPEGMTSKYWLLPRKLIPLFKMRFA